MSIHHSSSLPAIGPSQESLPDWRYNPLEGSVARPAMKTALWAVRPAIYLTTAGLVAWVTSLPEGPYGMGLVGTLWFGLLASVFLYLALLPGPLYTVLPNAPGRSLFLHARRAFGVASTLFAALHAYKGFYGWVGGFAGLKFWSLDYNLSLLLGAIALGILVLLAATSVDRLVVAMGPAWKRLHRQVHVAGLLIYVHAALITIHVLDLKPWLVGSFVALMVLLLLEALRLRRTLTGRVRTLAVWPLFALTCGLVFWSHFLISHHRH